LLLDPVRITVPVEPFRIRFFMMPVSALPGA
jgi:hypothetical protein